MVNWTLVPLRWRGAMLDGSPARGRIVARPSVDRFLVGDISIFEALLSAELVNGEAVLHVPATDDPTFSVEGFTYTIEEDLRGEQGSTYVVEAPLSMAAEGVDLNEAVPVTPSPGVPVSIVTRAEFDEVKAAVEAGSDVDLSEVEARLDTLTTSLSDLTALVEAGEDVDLSAVNAAIASLGTSLAELTARVDEGAEVDLSGVNAAIASLGTSLSELATLVDSNDTATGQSLASLSDAIEALDTSTAQSIEELSTVTIPALLGALSDRLDSLEGVSDTLTADVASAKSDAASATAALAGRLSEASLALTVATAVEDEVEARTPGTEIAHATRTTSFSTTSTSIGTAPIPGLQLQIVGKGRPVEIQLRLPCVFHSVANTGVVGYFAVSPDPTPSGLSGARVSSNTAAVGPSIESTARVVLTEGVTYTITAYLFGTAAGTSTVLLPSYGMAYLSVIAR